MEHIKQIGDFDTKINQKSIVVAIFRAEWCPDCLFIDPFINELFDEFSNKISGFNVNVDEFSEIKLKYSVAGIPSFIAFKDGKEINRFVSRNRKTKEEIKSFLKDTLSI